MYSNDFRQFKNIPSILRLVADDDEEDDPIQHVFKQPTRNHKKEPQLCSTENEFDPSIIIGRGDRLYVKRHIIERLIKETNYTEGELNNIKDMYSFAAEPGKGLNFENFKEFLRYVYNIDSHALAKRLFHFFDMNQDGVVEFLEVVKSLAIIEKGDFNEKVEICFRIYDSDDLGYIDMNGVRELLKLSFTNVLASLQSCILRVQKMEEENRLGITWKQFSDSKDGLLGQLRECLPIVIDRYDQKKMIIEELEFQNGFTKEKLDEFLKIYRMGQSKKESYNYNYYKNEMDLLGPTYITLNQWKLIMFDVFKVSDTTLLKRIFSFADRKETGTVSIESLVTEIVFHLSGPFQEKAVIFFKTNAQIKEGSMYLSKTFLESYLTSHLNFYDEVYKSAQDIAKHMRRPRQERIYLDDFKHFCMQFPHAMDFLSRITIGEYPQPTSPLLHFNYPGTETQAIQQEDFELMKEAEKFKSQQGLLMIKDDPRDVRENEQVHKRWAPRVQKGNFGY